MLFLQRYQAIYRELWISLFALGFTIACAGCGAAPENPDGRETVSGMITLNGKPLGGMAGISFVPVDGGDGGGQGQIKEGRYIISGYDGVKPGKYLVRIFATVDFDRSTGEVADNTIEFGNELTVAVVPPEFNKESTIEFEVVAGGKNVFNYDVQTDYVPVMPKDTNRKKAVPL